MEIKGIHEVYKLHTANNAITPSIRPEETTFKTKTDHPGQDIISISPMGSFQTALKTEVKKYAATQMQAPVSAQRIAILKEKYQGENCPIPGAEVAAAVLNRICGDPYSS